MFLKNLKEYFQHKPIITIVTNGLLLNKRNIDLLEMLDWLHISVHSHNEKFENIEKKGNFDTFVSNIKYIRKKFKKLNIHFEFVANEKNKNDVEEFIPWSFNELGVDTINIRRVFTNSYAPRSYLDQSLKNGNSISLKDSDWKKIGDKIKKIWPDANKSNSPGFGLDETLKRSPFTEVVEL